MTPHRAQNERPFPEKQVVRVHGHFWPWRFSCLHLLQLPDVLMRDAEIGEVDTVRWLEVDSYREELPGPGRVSLLLPIPAMPEMAQGRRMRQRRGNEKGTRNKSHGNKKTTGE